MQIAFDPARLAAAKRGFTTRTVPQGAMVAISAEPAAPRPGDLVLARVVQIGQHKQLEQPTSRKATLFVGDEVILAYGNRYAPDQFEACVPEDLGACDMVAAGGVAGRVLARHAKVAEPTRIEPIGLLVDASGAVLNLADFAVQPQPTSRRVPGIAVVGGSMNAGKTTAAANLVHGLTKAGYRVGAAKITGTGAGNDFWHMKDAGAVRVLDFTDAGLATTFRADLAAIEQAAVTLAAALQEYDVDVIVYEIADGLFQDETSALVKSRTLRSLVNGYVYAGESAASVAAGVQWLRSLGHLVLGVSGLVSASPLAAREAENATGYPCLSRETLATAAQGKTWMNIISPGRAFAA